MRKDLRKKLLPLIDSKIRNPPTIIFKTDDNGFNYFCEFEFEKYADQAIAECQVPDNQQDLAYRLCKSIAKLRRTYVKRNPQCNIIVPRVYNLISGEEDDDEGTGASDGDGGNGSDKEGGGARGGGGDEEDGGGTDETNVDEEGGGGTDETNVDASDDNNNKYNVHDVEETYKCGTCATSITFAECFPVTNRCDIEKQVWCKKHWQQHARAARLKEKNLKKQRELQKKELKKKKTAIKKADEELKKKKESGDAEVSHNLT